MNHLFSITSAFLLSVSASFAQVQFADVTQQAGLHFIGKNYGAAVADYNKDGFDDIFAISQSGPCRLYRNNGDGTFTDVAAEVGVAYVGTPNVAGWADVNNDGFLDLFIGNREENNVLYVGSENGTFSNNTFLSGLLTGGKVKALLFADINLDGRIDIYLARLLAENILYLNMGNGQFVNFTNASGAKDSQISMGAIFLDYDNDGDPDLYLTHDANQPNILYQNDGNGYFTDVSSGSGANIGTNGMGVDFADINQDGWLDIYVTNLYGNSLLLNNGNPTGEGVTFTEIADHAGVDDIGMGWGCAFLDVDNDGWADIYAANDSYFAPIPNVLYRNNQNLTFSIIENTPLISLEPGYGIATLDFNNDGKMDIYLANYVGMLGNQLFRNDSPPLNNWVKIKAEGTSSNRSAIGSRVTVEANGLFLVDEIAGSSGYASQSSFTLHFGLGNASQVDKLTIRWPNGLEEVYENLPVNTTHFLTEGEGIFTDAFSPVNGAVEVNATPNPFFDHLNIEQKNGYPQIASVALFDIYGKKIVEKKDVDFPEQWNTTGLLPGVYIMRVNMGGYFSSIKLIKQ